jgi:hypothetical protein
MAALTVMVESALEVRFTAEIHGFMDESVKIFLPQQRHAGSSLVLLPAPAGLSRRLGPCPVPTPDYVSHSTRPSIQNRSFTGPRLAHLQKPKCYLVHHPYKSYLPILPVLTCMSSEYRFSPMFTYRYHGRGRQYGTHVGMICDRGRVKCFHP